MNALKSLFGTVVSIASFGLIDLNSKMRSAYTVEILKSELEKVKFGRLENQEKYITALQNKRINEKNLERYKKDRKNVFDRMFFAKDENDTKCFTSLSIELKTKDEMIKNAEFAVNSLDDALKAISEANNNLEHQIQKMKSQIEILEAKKTMVDTMKATNKVVSKLYAPNGTCNTINLDELNKEWDDALIKEQTKAEVLGQFNDMTDDHMEFNSREEMETFLHDNYVE